LLWKKNCRKLLPIVLQNILYKTLFATNFVGNTCEFYCFVGNNYPQKNYLPIKILKKIAGKNIFLQIFLTNLKKNSYVTWEFLIVFEKSDKKRFVLVIFLINLQENFYVI